MVKKSVFRKLLVIIVSLVLIGGVSLVYLFKSYVSKNYLVELAEGAINSRVEIGDIDLVVFGNSGFRMENVRISQRDSLVEDGVAHDERPKMNESQILIKSLGLNVSIRDILSKKIDISKVFIEGADVKMVMLKNGDIDLGDLFRTPDSADDEELAKEDIEPEDKKSFNAKDQKEFVTLLRAAEIRDASVELLIEKTGLKTRIYDLNLLTKDIRIDPNTLETVNTATIEMSGNVSMKGKEGHEFGEINFSGPATVKLFNTVTGEMEPNATVDFQLSETSYLNPVIPALKKAWDKLDVLNKVGVKVGDIPERVQFGRARKLSASYHLGLAELNADVSLVVKDWEIAVLKGGWANIPQSLHAAHAELVAPEYHSKKVAEWFDKTLAKIPGNKAESVASDFRQNWFTSNNQLAVKIGSQGGLSKPKVSLATELPDFKKLLGELGKDRLQLEINKLRKDGDDDDRLKKEAGNLLRGLLRR